MLFRLRSKTILVNGNFPNAFLNNDMWPLSSVSLYPNPSSPMPCTQRQDVCREQAQNKWKIYIWDSRPAVPLCENIYAVLELKRKSIGEKSMDNENKKLATILVTPVPSAYRPEILFCSQILFTIIWTLDFIHIYSL